jgi:hypothetical protein
MPALSTIAEAQRRRAMRVRTARVQHVEGPPPWHAPVRQLMRVPHPKQAAFVYDPIKRKMVRAGRRGGKTIGFATIAVEAFLEGRRVLYAVPTQEQIDRFWFECKRALAPGIAYGAIRKNETRHILEIPDTENRIKAKTAWDADTLRGDFADLLILDEFQLMNEDAWGVVGAPMMLDTNGDAVFGYTPPSFRTAGKSKAHDPRHASKMFKERSQDTTGRWRCYTFTSHDNPYLSREALDEITEDMTALAYRQEILAQDLEETPGALWKLADIEQGRVREVPELVRIVVGIDPGHNAGVIIAGLGEDGHGYVLEDTSTTGAPEVWAAASVAGYYKYKADCLVPEKNHGGEMVESTIRHLDRKVKVKTVWASHGKYARAEPVSVLYAVSDKHQPEVHHVGTFAALEEEMCNWTPVPGAPSPNRMDALVWALTELMLGEQRKRVRAWGRK